MAAQAAVGFASAMTREHRPRVLMTPSRRPISPWNAAPRRLTHGRLLRYLAQAEAAEPRELRLLHLTELFFAMCIFCQIIEGVEPAHRIWESDDFLAFLSIHPCNPGHTCLIPKTHVDYVFDLQEPLYTRLFQVAKQLSKPLKSATDAKRIGIAVEGFSVPHVHLHLVPLYGVSELDPHRHITQTREELSIMAAKITDTMGNAEMEGAI